MTTISIKIPQKYNEYLDDTNEYQSIIAEVTEDYIEKKQDNNLKNSLLNNSYFNKLNSSLEKKLGKL